jgi:hypothetical protein
MAMEMTTAATLTPAETTGATMFDPMQRNKIGKWRRRCDAPVTTSDWCNGRDQA